MGSYFVFAICGLVFTNNNKYGILHTFTGLFTKELFSTKYNMSFGMKNVEEEKPFLQQEFSINGEKRRKNGHRDARE